MENVPVPVFNGGGCWVVAISSFGETPTSRFFPEEKLGRAVATTMANMLPYSTVFVLTDKQLELIKKEVKAAESVKL